MRLLDCKKPAMTWSEAAMLPARARTLSGGAALRQLARSDERETVRIQEKEQPAPAVDTALRRAAYASVKKLF
ncbi:MAG: hypothetical protein IJU12_06640 [Clostridia bacterium]|nr:hypothetical protein [Clostridia bacterium]